MKGESVILPAHAESRNKEWFVLERMHTSTSPGNEHPMCFPTSPGLKDRYLARKAGTFLE